MKKNTKRIWCAIFLCAILVTMSLYGCGQSEENGKEADTKDTEEAGQDAQEIRIGYIVKCLSNTFWQTYQEGAEAAAEELGVRLDVRDVKSEDDYVGQLDVARGMVNQDYDAIVAASITNTNLIPAIADANAKGIPWIVVSEKQDEEVLKEYDAKVTCNCRLSFYDEGVIAGKHVLDVLGEEGGQVAIIEGLTGTTATNDRIAGFRDTLEGSKIEIVASQPADWLREEAKDVTASILQANPDIKAIYALNDTMALGCVAALQQADKVGEIMIIGDDGTNEAYESIQNGEMDSTIDGVAWQIAYFSVHAAVKAVVENKDTLPDYDLTPGLITKGNVEEAMQEAPKPVAEMFEINENIYLPIAGIKE
ncbi:MAG: substrate-binding domain-containing protein [Ruminococcus sp.]|nr:substrate-binding domain-containing protein [Ruminococcus sp.]